MAHADRGGGAGLNPLVTPAPDDFLTVQQIMLAAAASLPEQILDFVVGGAESETTLRANREGFERLRFRQRVLRDVSRIDCRTTLLGYTMRLPVFLAPVGALALVHAGGIRAAARAAAAFGTVSFVSLMGETPLERVASEASGPKVFQLYVRGDRSWLQDMVGRVQEAGYDALCLTADTALYGRREQDLANRFFPAGAFERPNVADVMGPRGDRHQAAADWDTLAYLREIAGMPLVLKGVLDPEDARRAVDAGVAALYVSNHGGRQLDYAPATIDVLPGIVDAVAGRAEIYLDGGVTRGSDVVKALALGARAVGIGKLQAMALAAGGTPVLVRMLELLEAEMAVTMGLIGVTSVARLDPTVLYGRIRQ